MGRAEKELIADAQRWRAGRGPNPLLTRAVNADTASKYEKALRRFGHADAPSHRIDRLLAAHFVQLTAEGERPAKGELAIAGLLHYRPELKGRLARSARALRGWRAVMPGGEGGPVTYGAVGAVVVELLTQGKEEEALWAQLAFDSMGRGGELERLRLRDLADLGGDRAAIHFTTTKTGRDQGVVLRLPETLFLLRARVRALRLQGADGAHRLFSIRAHHFRRAWASALQAAGCPGRPAHALRHAGAAEAIAAGADFRDVKLRGRWAADSSLRRYTKTHLLIVYEKGMSALARLNGNWWKQDPIGEIRRARGDDTAPPRSNLLLVL